MLRMTSDGDRIEITGNMHDVAVTGLEMIERSMITY
jgi:hypothetical protein